MKTIKIEEDNKTEFPPIGGFNYGVESYLRERYDFLFNQVTQRPEFRPAGEKDMTPKPASDLLLNMLYRELNNQRINCTKDKLRCLLKSDFSHIYNPFHEYLNNLPKWDNQTDHIQQLCNTVKTTNDSFWKKSLQKWLMAMVASLLEDEIINHQIIVLTGPQGIGKTSWISKLVPEKLKNYKYSGVIDPRNKDTLRIMAENFLIDIDELESLQKHELSKLKQIITKPEISVRIQYDTYFTDMPHRASFIGSVNQKEFLSDLSGTRRFLCFDVTEIDYQHTINMDNVFSQALALYQKGEKYWFDKEEIDEINRINHEFQAVCSEEELLLKYYRPCEVDDARFLFTATEIVANIHAGVNNMRLSPTKMNAALKKNGFKETRRNNSTRAWAVKLNSYERSDEDDV